jgi:hypothetical protein
MAVRGLPFKAMLDRRLNLVDFFLKCEDTHGIFLSNPNPPECPIRLAGEGWGGMSCGDIPKLFR